MVREAEAKPPSQGQRFPISFLYMAETGNHLSTQQLAPGFAAVGFHALATTNTIGEHHP